MRNIGAYTQAAQLHCQLLHTRATVAKNQPLLPPVKPGDNQRGISQVAYPVELNLRGYS